MTDASFGLDLQARIDLAYAAYERVLCIVNIILLALIAEQFSPIKDCMPRYGNFKFDDFEDFPAPAAWSKV